MAPGMIVAAVVAALRDHVFAIQDGEEYSVINKCALTTALDRSSGPVVS